MRCSYRKLVLIARLGVESVMGSVLIMSAVISDDNDEQILQ